SSWGSRSTGRGRFGRYGLTFDRRSGHDRRGLAPPELVRRLLDRLDDVHVARAAAEVAGDSGPDLVLRRLRVPVEQPGGLHDHAGRAEPALQAVLVPEALLEGMEGGPVGHALDRPDRRPVRLDGEHRARLRTL